MMQRKFWKNRFWCWIRNKSEENFSKKPICLDGEWRLSLVEEYIKLYDSLGYVGYKFDMELSEIRARMEVYKKMDFLFITSALTALVINVMQSGVINDLNYNRIMLYLAVSSAVLLIILSIKLVFNAKSDKKWWFRPYFICVLVYAGLVFCFDLWNISALGCLFIIIFTLLTSYINYKSTEYRARLVALSYIKTKHDIK